MKVHDTVFVIDWGKSYSDITMWSDTAKKRVPVFPWKTEIPEHSGKDFHWKTITAPNLTLKGTVNKHEPTKVIKRIPQYEEYEYEVMEIMRHPNAGEWLYPDSPHKEKYGKYDEDNLLLLASITEHEWNRCYVVVAESGVSQMTPAQYASNEADNLIRYNLGKWDRESSVRKDIPKELVSVFYDENDRVLFGSSTIKGLVSYEYLEGKFSTDGKPIYLGCSILYDGKGNDACPDKSKIKSFEYIKAYVEN